MEIYRHAQASAQSRAHTSERTTERPSKQASGTSDPRRTTRTRPQRSPA
jgi:hypothetical protein